MVGEMCHIRAASSNGPRYDSTQTGEARHGFDNLILLCRNHHAVIDYDVDAYTVERLSAMKQAHETAAPPLAEPAASAGAAVVSVNQAGGITAGTLHVQTLHLHHARAVPEDSATASGRDAAARALLGPELARILAYQIRALDRAVANFICASVGNPQPNDHWTTFRPRKPKLYPDTPQFRDLGSEESALLSELYSGLEEIDELIAGWQAAGWAWDMNTWNVLMQKIERTVASGSQAAERFCPGRLYDATAPAAGTLSDRAAKSSAGMWRALEAHIKRYPNPPRQGTPAAERQAPRMNAGEPKNPLEQAGRDGLTARTNLRWDEAHSRLSELYNAPFLGQRPVLVSDPKLVVCAVPLATLDRPHLAAATVKAARPLFPPSVDVRIVEGQDETQWWTYEPTRPIPGKPNPESRWCFRLTRPGLLEAAATIGQRIDDDLDIAVQGRHIEALLVSAVDRIAMVADQIGLGGAVLVGAALEGLKDVEIIRARPGVGGRRLTRRSADLGVVRSERLKAPAADQLEEMMERMWLIGGWDDGSPFFVGNHWTGYQTV